MKIRLNTLFAARLCLPLLCVLIVACPACRKDRDQDQQAKPPAASETNPVETVEAPPVVKDQIIMRDGEPGNVTAYGANTQPPEGWPEYLGLYEGGTLVASQRTLSAGTLTLMLGFDCQDPPQDVFAYYIPRIKAEGFKVIESQDTGTFLSKKFEKQGQVLFIQSAEEKFQTKTYISLWIPDGQ
jgi:hypothetical protein